MDITRRVFRIASSILLVLLLGLLVPAVFNIYNIHSVQSSDKQRVTLALDFLPNAVHAGIYTALIKHYDHSAGVKLAIQTPASSTGTLGLLVSGNADLAILDISDLAIAVQQGHRLVGVMALVQQPLAAVLAQPTISAPQQLAGQQVAVSGSPGDQAVLHSILTGVGVQPRDVQQLTAGFQTTSALLTRRVPAAVGFWNTEGVTLKEHNRNFKIFKIDRFGAPTYPELIVVARSETLQMQPGKIRSALAAIVQGYETTMNNPEVGVNAMITHIPTLQRQTIQAQLAAVEPAFTSGVKHFGELNHAQLEAWSHWAVKFGILDHRPDICRLFNDKLLPS